MKFYFERKITLHSFLVKAFEFGAQKTLRWCVLLGEKFRELINYRKTSNSMARVLRRDQPTCRVENSSDRAQRKGEGLCLTFEGRSKVQVVSDAWVSGKRKRVLYSKEGVYDLEVVGAHLSNMCLSCECITGSL